eukprot:4280266-Amphidinium_carterae.1
MAEQPCSSMGILIFKSTQSCPMQHATPPIVASTDGVLTAYSSTVIAVIDLGGACNSVFEARAGEARLCR